MIAKVLSLKNNPTAFYILLSGVIFSIALYIYCVNAAVRNVVARKQAETEISALRNKLSDLEYKYISDENKMTLESATGLGLAEPKSKIFISRNSPEKELSMYNSR